MRIRLFLARVMSTKEFPTMERKKIVPYNGIIRFSRRLSWPDDCGIIGEVTLTILEVTVENRGKLVMIDESSLAPKVPKYSVETGLSDRLRFWIDIFLSFVLFDLSFSLSCAHASEIYSDRANVTLLWEMSLYQTVITHCIRECFAHCLLVL